jgi:hypothetical protein
MQNVGAENEWLENFGYRTLGDNLGIYLVHNTKFLKKIRWESAMDVASSGVLL